MTTQLFTGPRAKTERALQHVTSLQAEIATYLGRKPWAMLLERHRRSGRHQIALRGREPIPPVLSVILGDALHNLRSALDHLANDIVALSGAIPKGVYFPFAASSEALEEQLRDKLKGAASDVVERIRQLRPYRGGNELLRALHDLDVTDKHKSLITAAASGATAPLVIHKSPSTIPGRLEFHAFLHEQPTTPIDVTGFPIESTIEVVGEVTGSSIELAIANGLPLHGKSVATTAVELHAMVNDIINMFSVHFESRREASR